MNETNPIKLTLTLIPIETQVTFGSGGNPIRRIKFVVDNTENTELELNESFPDFNSIWESVNKYMRPINYNSPDKYITQLYEKYTSDK